MTDIKLVALDLDGTLFNSNGKITEKTRLSTATISRVNRSYLYGAGGYDKIFCKIGDPKK